MAQVLDSIDMIYFGNPIYDITIQDDNCEVMQKYNL